MMTQKEDNMMPNMMMPNEETMKKLTGNIAVEVQDGAYRNAASLLVEAVTARTKTQLGPNNAITTFLRDNVQVGEAVVGFVLAAILEFVPTTSLMETKTMLAHNLRVRSYEELIGLLLKSSGMVQLLTGALNEEVERAIRLAGVQQKPTVQQPAKTNGTVGAESPDHTAASAAPAGD